MHKPTEEVRRLFDKKIYEKSTMNKGLKNKGAVTSRKENGKEHEIDKTLKSSLKGRSLQKDENIMNAIELRIHK